jgi:murein L,D-transpeptidase YcbB/YkuD
LSRGNFPLIQDTDLAQILEQALAAGQVGAALTNLKPSGHDYERLREAYVRYRDLTLSGGWPLVPGGPKLQREDRGARVRALRTRLAATGDLDQQQVQEADMFDEGVEQGLRRFQWRHGLVVDGVTGPETLAALNLPAEDRAWQIALNMERWRWQPADLGPRHILVNVANFALEVVEEDRVLLSLRTVVGKPYRRTPVFSAKMTYLVFSPFWHVPPGIARRDILPRIHKDAAYLSRERIRAFLGWGSEAVEVDTASVDWNQIEPRSLPYRFRQEPGPSNPLGGVKFMFPNRFNVYLHDTPSKELFDEVARTFSSGCIRVENAAELASYLLRRDSSWTPERIHNAMSAGREKTVSLPEPIAVHLRYWTTWVDRDGAVHFRDDVYQRDKMLEEALSAFIRKD